MVHSAIKARANSVQKEGIQNLQEKSMQYAYTNKI